MRLDKIELENIEFKWGMDITTLKSKISAHKYIEDETIHSNTLRIKINEQWGIKCNSCEFFAPSTDRLITQFQINLGHVDNLDSLLNKLDKQFGTRASDTVYSNYGSGSVIKNCTWDFENCGAGISIYGGKRTEYDEKNYGMIFFYIQDLKLIHDLYSSTLALKTDTLERNTINKKITYQIYTLSQKQQLSSEMEKSKYPDYDSDYISLTFNSLYNKNLLITPSSIRKVIQENQVCIFSDPITSEQYIANHWECYSLHHVELIDWYNILPARGPGYCSINIDSFNITNNHSQEITQQLIHDLEKILRIEIKCIEESDS